MILVSYTLAGVVYRRASGPRAVTIDGDVWSPGIISASTDELAESTRATLEVYHDSDQLLGLVAQGLPLSGGSAAVYYLHEDSTTLDDALVLVRGDVSRVVVDDTTSKLKFAVDDAYWRQPTLYPGEDSIISEYTWPSRDGYSIDENILGAIPPTVFGFPGRWIPTWMDPGLTLMERAATSQEAFCTPAYLVEGTRSAVLYQDSAWVIADHHVAASEVAIEDVSDGISDLCDVTNGYDLRGRAVALAYYSDMRYFPVSPPSSVRPKPGHEYRVKWGDDREAIPFTSLTSSGGMLGPDGEVMDGAGDIMAWMLARRTRQDTDTGYNTGLNRYQLDCWVSGQVDPERWVTTHLGKVFPLAKVLTARGSTYALLRYDALPSDATGRLVVDSSAWSASGGVTYSDVTANKVTFRYYYVGRDYLGEVTDTSLLAQASQDRWGVLEEVVETQVIERPWVAQAAAHAYLCWRGWPHELVEYVGPAREATRYHVGQVITITHAARQYTERVALVTGITVAGAQAVLSLTVLSHYLADARSV